MSIRRFEEIEDWQLAREPTRPVYPVAMRKSFAKDFGLRDQIARAGEFDSIYQQAAHARESRRLHPLSVTNFGSPLTPRNKE